MYEEFLPMNSNKKKNLLREKRSKVHKQVILRRELQIVKNPLKMHLSLPSK